MHRLLVFLPWVLLMSALPAAEPATVTLEIGSKPANPVPAGLFGQFMERASWGEWGPEWALQAEGHELRPAEKQMLKDFGLTHVRFPAGSDLDSMDWRDLVDHMPHRKAPARPAVVTGHKGDPIETRFGYAEFLALRDELGFEALIPVKLLNAVKKAEALEDVAFQAAALVAWCNAPVDADLDPKLLDYAKARAKSGRVEPWGVKQFQVGNETWFILRKVVAGEYDLGGESPTAWYLRCLKAVIGAMKAVDPTIGIVTDGHEASVAGIYQAVAADPFVREHVTWLSAHTYGPFGTLRWQHDEGYAFGETFARDAWLAFGSTLGDFGADGLCAGHPEAVDRISGYGYPAVITEWNWNGFRDALEPDPPFDPAMAKAIATAGFLHGLMRDGGRVAFADQSMLIGDGWDIAAIRVDREGRRPPRLNAQGRPTSLYARHHGDRRLPVAGELPTVEPELHLRHREGWPRKLALVDPVATVDDQHLYLHLVNRSHDRSFRLEVAHPGHVLAGTGAVHRIGEGGDGLEETTHDLAPFDGSAPLVLELPPKTVQVVVLPLR